MSFLAALTEETLQCCLTCLLSTHRPDFIILNLQKVAFSHIRSSFLMLHHLANHLQYHGHNPFLFSKSCFHSYSLYKRHNLQLFVVKVLDRIIVWKQILLLEMGNKILSSLCNFKFDLVPHKTNVQYHQYFEKVHL